MTPVLFRQVRALGFAATALLPAAASAQRVECRPTGTCEYDPAPVAPQAQAPVPETSTEDPPGRFIVYVHAGFGTPYGVLGLSLDALASNWLVLEAGVGANPDEGPEAGFAPRVRLEIVANWYVTLGSGVSWSRRYVGHPDPLGELIAENTVAHAVWSPAYFWNTELGVEARHEHFAFRIYPGYAKVINSGSYTCSEGQGCAPDAAASLIYFGTALGYHF